MMLQTKNFLRSLAIYRCVNFSFDFICIYMTLYVIYARCKAACKMAVAISQDTFVDVRPREDDFVSESGITMGSTEIEELIEGEICRLGESRHRIDAKLICQSLKKAHGLSESTVLLSLSYMINTGRIKKEEYRGSETLKLSEERSKEAIESLSTSKVSSDNEKIIQYRSELLEIASGDDHDSDSTTDSTSDSETLKKPQVMLFAKKMKIQ